MKKRAVKLALAMLLIALLTGCGMDDKRTGDNFSDHSSRFVLVEKLGNSWYVAADKESGYTYFISYTRDANYVIGGNVLDKDGKPVKIDWKNLHMKE